MPATDDGVWSAWTWWAFGTLAGFAMLEAAALRNNQAHTLTATTRRVLGIRPAQPWAALGAASFAAGCAVLASHVVLGRP